MTEQKITVYSTTWCADCRRTKAFLDQQGVAYREIDIEQDEAAAELVMKHNDGKRRVPTLEVAGAYYGNPTIPELRSILSGAA
ncbi:MAG: glutaredoxin family protein [Acidobacteriota bacterium]